MRPHQRFLFHVCWGILDSLSSPGMSRRLALHGGQQVAVEVVVPSAQMDLLGRPCLQYQTEMNKSLGCLLREVPIKYHIMHFGHLRHHSNGIEDELFTQIPVLRSCRRL